MPATVEELFTSATVGLKYAMGRRMVVAVGGIGDAAWVGTIKFRWTDGKGIERYVTDSTGTDVALTTNGWADVLDFSAPVKVRAEATAWASGTIRVSITPEDMVTG